MDFIFNQTPNLRLRVNFTYCPGTDDTLETEGDPEEIILNSLYIEKLEMGTWVKTGIDLLGWIIEEDSELYDTILAKSWAIFDAQAD